MKALLALMCVMAAGSACAYPENYASPKMGASVICEAKLDANQDPNKLLSDAPAPRGQLVFSTVDQKQVFTVDLGDERIFDRVEFGTGAAGSDRNAKRVRIEVSRKSLEGPYEAVFEKKDLALHQILRLPKVKARWVRFDLGEGPEGALVHTFRIYKGYEHSRLAEVTRLLYERIKPDLPGLEGFYKEAGTGDWNAACSALRDYCRKNYPVPGPPDPKYNLSLAEALTSGELDFAGLKRHGVVPIDWSYMKTGDWYEHKNELNCGRPIGMPVLAAYNTGDKKWAQYAKSVFYDWIDANPKPTVMSGADYPCWRTLDSAARSSWLTTCVPEVVADKNFDDEFFANWLFSIWEHADYIKNDDFTSGNWLAHSAGAVMGIAMEYPFFSDQRIWLDYGKSSFEKNVLRDVYPDGKEAEDAPGHVCFAYETMLGTLRSLDDAHISVDSEVRKRLEKTAEYLAAVTQPDGNMPAIGDWGGGPAYPLTKAQEYFKRQDIKYVLTRGKEGKMPEKASVSFPQGQWSIMRSAYDEKPYENARQLVFKSSCGTHGHNDVLEITNYAYGRELLIDPGIRSYEHADLERYPQTSYHNTICIDGKSQSNTDGRTDKWISNAGLDYVIALHHGYKDLTHVRGVLFVKPNYWIVRDEVEGQGEHTYDQNWRFAEDAGLVEDPVTKAVHTKYPKEEVPKEGYTKDGNLLMIPIDPVSLKSEVTEFYIATSRTGCRDPVKSKGWKYSKSGAVPVSFDTVLYPYMGTQVPNVTVSRMMVEGDAAGVTALKIAAGDSVDYVIVSRKGPQVISVTGERLKVDAEIAVVRTKAGKPVRASGANVKSINLGGTSLFSKDEPAADVDVAL